jgi:hypothetical protein
MAFVQRLLSYQVSGKASISVPSGLRSSCHIFVHTKASLARAEIRIWGMPQTDMNSISTLGMRGNETLQNHITIMAGDTDTGMTKIFQGDIIQALADYQSMPDVPMNIQTKEGNFFVSQNANPVSYPGNTSVTSIMQNYANQMGYNFEGNNVNVQLHSPYFWGSLLAQARHCADSANCNLALDNGTMAIWPYGGSRQTTGSTGTTISPGTGMIGYPSAGINNGVKVRTLFNPGLKVGTPLTIQGSSVSQANGTFIIFTVEHDLESWKPGGQWFTTVDTYAKDTPFGQLGG